ncbi:Piwi domain-containing protein [Pedobacter terrae]|uniref:Piwi domain-containing protein n=1 Tax=Pedobacter terrae TaxID=405671 RepID=UPI002FFAFC57
MAQIRLNFLALSDSSFSFTVFRKPKDVGEKLDKTQMAYSFTNEETQLRCNYIISFSSDQNFEPYKVSSHDFIGLTKKFLLLRLLSSISNSSNTYKFYHYKSFTDEQIEFVLEEFAEGNRIIVLTPYYLEEQNKFGFLIDFKFAKNKDVVFNKHVQRLSLSLDDNFRSNKNYYSDKYHIIQNFISNSYPSWARIQIGNDLPLEISNQLTEVPSFLLGKKEYLFNINNAAYSQFQGLRNYGPFKKIDQDVLFVFIFETRFKSFANQLYLSLLGKLNPGTFSGFESMFKLKFGLSNVKQISLNSNDQNELKNVAQTVKNLAFGYEKVIGIFVEDHDEENKITTSPNYYYLKYNFIKEDIPLQVVNYRTLGEKNSLKWSTSNVALAIFSKLGGIPWIVKPSNTNCLILGIGSSHKIDHETGEVSKYFAYSVCLDSSGLYKSLEVLADETEHSHYLEKLQSNLVNLLNSGKYSNYTSCVLHLPFKIKHREIEALTKALAQVSSMEFIVIKINLDNKFFGYSTHNTYVPYESSFIKLSRNEYLVWFEGLLYGKEIVDKRMGNPVHIQFLNLPGTKSFDERKYLQDVLNLSGANWRGFNAKSIPISIYYSQIIAKYTKAFETLDSYDESILSNERPWFL